MPLIDRGDDYGSEPDKPKPTSPPDKPARPKQVGGEKFNFEKLNKFKNKIEKGRPANKGEPVDVGNGYTVRPQFVPRDGAEDVLIDMVSTSFPEFDNLVTLYRDMARDPYNRDKVAAYTNAMLAVLKADPQTLMSVIGAGVIGMYLLTEMVQDKKKNDKKGEDNGNA